ncbi:MAG: c-type cytochrome [Xanthomonadaceae bacterium]|nr:c-type cytochrome [Xanthomonadaceae bacterium]MBU6477495.1 c-type cytochrome [Xanthomonadaceae bacterium]MDE2223842.1 c-type cytochrome [Xanthomonadaceae bacterium]MDE2496991.1 c-type cytochrome [Xanthomonadaceae bacterium]
MMNNPWAILVASVASLACTAAIAAPLVGARSASVATDAQATSAPAASATSEPAGLKDAKASDCFACHAIDHKVVGPAYDEVAKRYAGKGSTVVDKLAEKIIRGGSGNWGSIAMTPHPDLGQQKARTIVEWILSLKPAAGASAVAKSSSEATAKTYTYKKEDGKTVKLDFPVFVAGHKPEIVTKDVFTGYEQFNAYCNRCHGDDAVGGAYAAPDLRHSLTGGMSYQEFLQTAMAGRESKGMPSWAGFFTPEQIRDIYEYVKGRQVDLIPTGRPPSAQD